MSEHGGIPIPNLHERRLPNQTFWAWLRTETALFISQIATVLGIVLYVATFSYYVFGKDHSGHETSFEEYLDKANTVIFYSNIVVCLLFILVLIFILNKNDEGEYHVKKSYLRLFKKEITKEGIEKGKERLKWFKTILIIYWTYATLFYLFFLVAGKHLPELVMDGFEVSLNTLQAFIIFFCYREIKLSNRWKDEQTSYAYKPYIIWTAYAILILLFIIFLSKAKHHELFGLTYPQIKTGLMAFSGVIIMISIATLISRLDSKLIGIPSILITLIYGYAVIQPLMPLFDLHPAIKSVAYFLAFIFKIYFTIVVIYILQTGRLLNFVCSNSELSIRLRESRNKFFDN